jgi:hypothetical protein
MADVDELEARARRARSEVGGDLSALRTRLQPANIVASVQDSAQRAATPYVERLTADVKAHGGALSLAAGALGYYLAPGLRKRNGASPADPVGRAAPGMSGQKAAIYVGAGAVAGALLASRLPMSRDERAVYGAVRADVSRGVGRLSSRQFDRLAKDQSSGASAMKLAASLFALLAVKTTKA